MFMCFSAFYLQPSGWLLLVISMNSLYLAYGICVGNISSVLAGLCYQNHKLIYLCLVPAIQLQ